MEKGDGERDVEMRNACEEEWSGGMCVWEWFCLCCDLLDCLYYLISVLLMPCDIGLEGAFMLDCFCGISAKNGVASSF